MWLEMEPYFYMPVLNIIDFRGQKLFSGHYLRKIKIIAPKNYFLISFGKDIY